MSYERAGVKILLSFMIISMVILAVFLLPDQLIAQPPPFPLNPEQTPIDGGLGILAAIGGAYAIKKIREKE